MHKSQTQVFDEVVSDIIKHNKYQELKNEFQHGLSRYTHSKRVAKITYSICKKFKLDYISATRAAMLHDFYKNDECINKKGLKKGAEHPIIACENAKKYFGINVKEENIIKSHMYPLFLHMPKHAESWIVAMIDNGVALYELIRFRLTLAVSIWILFMFNMFVFGQK